MVEPTIPTPDNQTNADMDQLKAQLRQELLGGAVRNQQASTTGGLLIISRRTWLGIFAGVLSVATILTIWIVARVNYGKVDLVVTPDNAQIRVDGSAISQKGVVKRSLQKGEHTALITLTGYRDQQVKFTVFPNKTTSVQVTLRSVAELMSFVETASFLTLSDDGKYLAYYDVGQRQFIKYDLAKQQGNPLFGGAVISNVDQVVWAPSAEQAIVKLRSDANLPNTVDNRGLPGKYLPIGDRPASPVAVKSAFNGQSNWLFDNSRYTARGWQAIRLTNAMRQVDWSPFGDQILYFFQVPGREQSFMQSLPDGSEWERLGVEVTGTFDLKWLKWKEHIRYALLFGQFGQNAQDTLVVLDKTSGEMVEVLKDQSPISVVDKLYWADGGSELWRLQDDGTIERWMASNKSMSDKINVDRQLQQIVPTGDGEAIGVDAQGNLYQFGLDGKTVPVSFIGDSGRFIGAKLVYSTTLNYLIAITSQGGVIGLAL